MRGTARVSSLVRAAATGLAWCPLLLRLPHSPGMTLGLGSMTSPVPEPMCMHGHPCERPHMAMATTFGHWAGQQTSAERPLAHTATRHSPSLAASYTRTHTPTTLPSSCESTPPPLSRLRLSWLRTQQHCHTLDPSTMLATTMPPALACECAIARSPSPTLLAVPMAPTGGAGTGGSPLPSLYPSSTQNVGKGRQKSTYHRHKPPTACNASPPTQNWSPSPCDAGRSHEQVFGSDRGARVGIQ